MIDAKQAVVVARQGAADWLGKPVTLLEEIERDSYQGRDVWAITLSFPRDPVSMPAMQVLVADPLKYKRFLIDVNTGELLAMKVREPATQ